MVVRTWQPERDRRVVLVLDTSRTSAGRVDDVPRLDAAMDAALLLAALAARAGDRVDLVAGDRRYGSRLRLAASSAVAVTLQDAMSDLQPIIAEADWSTLAGAVQGLGRQRALVVLLTPLEPSSIEEGLLPVLPTPATVTTGSYSRRCAILPWRSWPGATTPPPRCTTPPQPRRSSIVAVAPRTSCEPSGSTSSIATPRVSPTALADHYLMLKARGLL